jgi:hypothetical protein
MTVNLLTDANPHLFELIKCHDRYLLPYGGGGSGKSYEGRRS